MRPSTILSLGASALLGVGALVVAKVWLPGAGPGAPAQAAVNTVPVVAASTAIAYGTKLDEKNLTVLRVPAAAAPEGAYRSIDEVIKLEGGAPVALTQIAAREPVLPFKLSGGGAKASVAAVISPGMRAYTIKVSEEGGVGGHALPGDRVDVLLSRQADENGPVTVDVVLQNVRLLGMNFNADPSSTEVARPETATLEVSVEDAGRLSIAAKVGLLSLALRRTGQADIETVQPIALSRLRAYAGEPRPAAPRRAPAPRAPGLVIVNGDERSAVGAGA